jgi:hypothetical protein
MRTEVFAAVGFAAHTLHKKDYGCFRYHQRLFFLPCAKPFAERTLLNLIDLPVHRNPPSLFRTFSGILLNLIIEPGNTVHQRFLGTFWASLCVKRSLCVKPSICTSVCVWSRLCVKVSMCINFCPSQKKHLRVKQSFCVKGLFVGKRMCVRESVLGKTFCVKRFRC